MSWIEATGHVTNTKGQLKKFSLQFFVEQNEEIIDKIQELEPYCNDIKIENIKLISSCIGCREEQPNQLAHMDFGGCLYQVSDEEEDDEEEEEEEEDDNNKKRKKD